jgi:hypothetical protein
MACASAGTSAPSAATPKRRDAPASRSGACVWSSSRSAPRWPPSAASWPPRASSPSTRARAAATCCCSPSPDRSSRAPAKGSASALLDDVVAVVESLRREETAAIGIGVPSIVELATGRIRYSLNIPLIDLPLREILTERIGSGHRGRRVNGRQPAARSRARDRTPFRVSRGRHRMRNPPRSHRGRSRNPRRRAAGQDRAQATRCHQLLTVSTGRCSRFASAARVRAGYRESCRVSASTGSPGAPAARPRRALAGFAGGSVGGDQPAEEALREPVGMCSDETWSVPPSATKLNSDHVTRVHSPQVTNVNCLLGREAVSHNRSPGSPHRSRTRTVRRTTFT